MTQEDQIIANVHTFTSIISALGASGDLTEMMQWYHKVTQRENYTIYVLILLLQMIDHYRIQPDSFLLSVITEKFATHHQQEKAIKFLRETQFLAHSMPPTKQLPLQQQPKQSQLSNNN